MKSIYTQEESFDGVSPIDVLTNSLAISSSLNEDELYFWKVVAVDEEVMRLHQRHGLFGQITLTAHQLSLL